MHDVVAAMGPAFLGSRLKRLGEWLQADAAAIIAEMGLPIVPAQVPVLTALRAGPLTIGQIAAAIGSSQPGVSRTVAQLQKLGLVESARGNDQRERRVGLSASGNAAMIILARDVWPRVGAAAAELYADASGPLLTQACGSRAGTQGRTAGRPGTPGRSGRLAVGRMARRPGRSVSRYQRRMDRGDVLA